MNVLIIEDNDHVREALAATLHQHLKGCTILTACNGEEGVSILRSTPLALILTDLQMPIKDGYGVIEYKNNNYPEIPLLVMTADNTAEMRQKLSALGVSQFIQKPFDFDLISKMIGGKLFSGQDIRPS